MLLHSSRGVGARRGSAACTSEPSIGCVAPKAVPEANIGCGALQDDQTRGDDDDDDGDRRLPPPTFNVSVNVC